MTNVLSYQQSPSKTSHVLRHIAFGFLFSGIGATFIGYPFMLWEVESVLFIGPVLILCGTVATILLIATKRWSWLPIAVSQIAIPMFFILCVNLFDWGPGDARRPFALMGAAYLCLLPLAILGTIFLSPKNTANPT